MSNDRKCQKFKKVRCYLKLSKNNSKVSNIFSKMSKLDSKISNLQLFLGWALFYLFNSFRSPLPWTTCGNDWNSDCCTTEISVHENGSSFLVKPENCSESVSYPELEFWKRRTLQVNQSPGIDNLGEMRWELVGLVFFAWVVTFFCIFS